MKRAAGFLVLIIVATALMVTVSGCQDGVRQTMVPYVFSGLQTIADSLVGDLQSEPDASGEVVSGLQSITAGLIAGLQRQVYPKG